MKPLGFKFEEKILSEGYSAVVGCDEVGRGALAGPIVAAAVSWNAECRMMNAPTLWSEPRTASVGAELSEVRDSKLLSPRKREELVFHIKHHALAWSVAVVSPQVIDKINIHQANLLALYRAVNKLHQKLPKGVGRSHVLVDGRFSIPQWLGSQTAVVDGDAKVFSIAAASIIAKVYRDQLMMKLDGKFPGYEFARHKGYGTAAHARAIARLGLCWLHRKSFCTKHQQ